MGKSFDEWYKENDTQLEDKVYKDYGWADPYFSSYEFQNALKEAWDASRQNMTYKDI